MTVQGSYAFAVPAPTVNINVIPYVTGIQFPFQAWLTRMYAWAFIQAVTTGVPRFVNTLLYQFQIASQEAIHASIQNNMQMNPSYVDNPNGILVSSQQGNVCDVRYPVGEIRCLPNQIYNSSLTAYDNFATGDTLIVYWQYEYQPQNTAVQIGLGS